MSLARGILGVLTLAMAACAPGKPPELDPALRLQPSAALLLASSFARECSSPAPAKTPFEERDGGWKYGCFCGAGHPKTDVQWSDLDGGALSVQIILHYFAVKPIDDVDAVCRDHDVCWILHGDGNGECNDEFYKRMSYVHDVMLYHSDVGSPEWKCHILTGDIATSSLTALFPSQHADPAKDAGAKLGKATTIPLIPPIILMRAPLWVGDNYPSPDDRCNLPVEYASASTAEAIDLESLFPGDHPRPGQPPR